MLHDSILIFPHAKNERCEKGGEIPNAKLLKLNHKESEVIMDHVLYTVFLWCMITSSKDDVIL